MKTFTKIFEQLSYRHGNAEVFSDFLEATVCAFTLGKMENEYAEIMKRYDPDEIPLFGQMLGALISEYEKQSDSAGRWTDPLGRFFEEYNGKWSRERSGQFFTPEHLCNLMARMTEPSGSICDPCCGSGRNLIAADRMNPMNRYLNHYTAMDVDRRCVNMCVINFTMFGMSGTVIHMDTLSMEIYRGYRVWLPETGLGVQPLTAQQCRALVLSNRMEEDSVNYQMRRAA